MYLGNNKNNTNIDDEFKQSKNILSNIKIKKNKLIIFIAISIIIILLILMICLFVNKEESIYLTLNGEETITIYQDTEYIEPGYDAYNSKNENLNDVVRVISNLDTSNIGEYKIEYIIGDITKIRRIIVIEKPKDITYIYLKTVDKDTNIYLKKGEKYIEPGYQVFSSTGNDLTSEVKVTGTVDTNKEGSYILTYSLIDSNGVTISVSRTVVVMDADVSLTLSANEYTNQDITINVKVTDNNYDYMILPDNTKITSNSYSYKVSSNGTYKFKVYNNKGIEKESSIEVKNIDKIAPTGSCTGYYKNKVSTIDIKANDESGINQYIIDNKTYTQNQITLNGELKSINITIYDKAGNTKNISCTLEDKNEMITSSSDITFNYEYVYKSNGVSYALYTPSTASSYEKIPLIIWLHGSGERGVNESAFKNSGFLYALNNWSLEGFNAYVLCPHISKETTSSWGSGNIKEKFYTLFNEILATKNIDTDKIILSGHSMGGIGVYEVADGKNDLFSAYAVMSGYNYNGIDLTQYMSKPIKGYVGTPQAGEDESSYNHMINGFVKTFGQDKLTIYEKSHGRIPQVAFTEDKNNDNKSDLIEWMLTQKK